MGRRGLSIAVLLTASILLVAGCSAGSTSAPVAGKSSAAAAPGSTRSTAETTGSDSSPGAHRTLPAGGRVPAGFSVASVTAVSDTDWWVLGRAPCSSPPCTSIARTTDGGAHWTGIPAPRTSLESTGHTGVSQLRYGDVRDGYAFDPQLWTTHDGGSTWNRSSLTGTVTDLAISNGTVYAVVRRNDHQRMLSSPVSHDSWRQLPAPHNLLGSLWVQGEHIFAQDSTGPNDDIGKHLLYSPDGGAHWQRAPLPVPGLPCSFDQVAPPVLWEKCATGMQAAIWISHDNGMTFRDPQRRNARNPWGNSMVFGAASNTVGVAAFRDLRRTTDGGRTYHRVPQEGAGPKVHDFVWSYLGFTDPAHGLAVGVPQGRSGPGQLWASDDAGASWHRVPIS